MAVSSSPRPRRSRTARSSAGARMVFERHNYVLLLIGLALVVVGYVVMRVDNQVDGFLSLYVAPLLLLGGYLEIIYAILWRDTSEDAPAEDAARQA